MTAEARYLEADRAQVRWDVVDLESLLVSDHRARIAWAFVQGVELPAFYAPIKACEGEPGTATARSGGCAGALVVRDLGGGGLGPASRSAVPARRRVRGCARR